MSRSKFFDKMQMVDLSPSTDKERMVEDVYVKGISLYFKGVNIEHPFKCDGYFSTKTEAGNLLKLIIEYKYDEDMKSRITRAGIILQVLFYLKRFEADGMILPNVAMVGDVNECFVFHVNDIIKWLDEDIDWSAAPSRAADLNRDLVIRIADDTSLNPFVFNIDENFSFKFVADRIKELADNVQRYVHVTEHNIATIFDYFTQNVVTDRKISANDLVSVFLGVIKDPGNYYQHPSKRNVLVTPRGNVAVKPDSFSGFIGYFSRTYTPQEKMLFDSISDRLIEDTNRRAKGEFYTPTIFVDYTHKMISEQFGENWKDEYVVYDCCCGTKNLTRDYRFKELYCSTLEEAELEISERYNREAVSFKFDFLNDPLDKLPKGLLDAFERNKPIIFFLNPPYATGCNFGETSKEGTNNTLIRNEMHNIGLGAGAENIQHQFIYRICEIKKQFNLKNANICLFSNPIYLSGGKQCKFLNYFCDNFEFTDGIIFKASEFANVASTWGITFNIWKSGITEDKNNFLHKIVETIDNEILTINDKIIYNVNGCKTLSEFVREDVKGLKTYDYPCVSSALKVMEKNTRVLNIENNLGYYYNNSNSVSKNSQNVALFSTSFGHGHGNGISIRNFIKCTTAFAARRIIADIWYNHTDEYLAPNESHPKYNEFVNDSIIYSLFDSKSQQSSLRQIDYKGKKWDIKNEFFWLPKAQVMAMATANGNDETFHDAHTDGERYVHTLLLGTKSSPEAQAVIDKASELLADTFRYRPYYNEEHPEMQVNNWDCGYYQLKNLWKEYAPEGFDEFKTLYKALGDKMRPMVYELGFLKS